MGKLIKLKKMKYTLLIAGASAISLRESKPLIHPQTGLAITTTGQHWYGQPPLAMAERSDKDVGVTHYDPWVRQVVHDNVNPVPMGGRAMPPNGEWWDPFDVSRG